MEGDLEGDSKGDCRGDFKQDMEGDLLSNSGQVRSRSGLVQVWFSLQPKFNSFELDSEVGRLVSNTNQRETLNFTISLQNVKIDLQSLVSKGKLTQKSIRLAREASHTHGPSLFV